MQSEKKEEVATTVAPGSGTVGTVQAISPDTVRIHVTSSQGTYCCCASVRNLIFIYNKTVRGIVKLNYAKASGSHQPPRELIVEPWSVAVLEGVQWLSNDESGAGEITPLTTSFEGGELRLTFDQATLARLGVGGTLVLIDQYR